MPTSPLPKIAVALSGGADSMALTLLAQTWATRHHYQLVTLTVDHGLRENSHAEAQQIAGWMQLRGIEHRILKPPHVAAGNNIMQAARQWRYDALAQYCTEDAILHCLIAHHEDDQLETSMLQQQRGDTQDGGSGMARARIYHNIRFLRPLLETSKAELVAYLRDQHIPWIEDPTNQRTEFARTRVRQQLHADPALRHQLATTQQQARDGRHAREKLLAQVAADCASVHPAGFITIDCAVWSALKPSLASGLLANALRTVSGATNRARNHEIMALDAALRDAPHGRRSLQQCDIQWNAQTMTIARELAHVAAPITLSGQGETQWDKRFHVRYQLPENVALSLRALGRVRLDAAPHLRLHASTPSLWHLDELVAVPHITSTLPADWHVTLGFNPAKSLAATPFW